MSYLDDLAAEIRRQLPRTTLSDGDARSLFRLYAVLALAKGPAVEAVDVHNAWVAWMQERDPGHRAIRPYEELDPETQASDEPFAAAIRAVAERLARAPVDPPGAGSV